MTGQQDAATVGKRRCIAVPPSSGIQLCQLRKALAIHEGGQFLTRYALHLAARGYRDRGLAAEAGWLEMLSAFVDGDEAGAVASVALPPLGRSHPLCVEEAIVGLGGPHRHSGFAIAEDKTVGLEEFVRRLGISGLERVGHQQVLGTVTSAVSIPAASSNGL